VSVRHSAELQAAGLHPRGPLPETASRALVRAALPNSFPVVFPGGDNPRCGWVPGGVGRMAAGEAAGEDRVAAVVAHPHLALEDVEQPGGMMQVGIAGAVGGARFGGAALSVGAAGAVGPGNSPGLLQVFGDADFLAGSALAVELGGPAFGTGHDRLDVSDDAATTGTTEGTVNLADGTVFDIDWFGAFTAGDGDFFDVLVADDFAPFNLLALIFDFGGTALGTGLAWETTLVDFGGGREALRLSVVTAAISEVPAPGAIVIFALGLARLGYARRKRA